MDVIQRPRPLRIALVAPIVTAIAQPYVGGAQAMLADLAQGLARRGHAVTLFAREGSVVPGITIEELSVPDSVRPTQFSASDQLHSLPDPGFIEQCNIFLQLFLALRQRQDEFDVIHAHAFDWPSFACSALIERIPVIHTIHLPAIVPEINAGLRVLHQQGHPLTLVTVSQSCARTYEPYTPFDHIISNGLDIAQISFVADQPASDAPLLFAGRITPEKGVLEAIEIARRANRSLLIAGGIYDTRYFEQCVRPAIQATPERITYLGQLDHQRLWSLMGKVAGLLFPIAWDEPFGLTPVEAMAAGSPVIAFERGAAAEIIRHGETGFLVPPGDIATAAAAVDRLAGLSRQKCRVYVEEHFSFAAMLAGYERVYYTAGG